MKSLVSIIIPVYNAEKFIAETIDSVLKQNHTNWELIIVNDGSTDKSTAVIDHYIKADKRIFLFNKENSGVSDTRNFGTSKAKGSYIAFLDADDVWLPDNLQKKIEFLNASGSDAVYSFCEIINEYSERSGVIKKGDDAVSLENILLWEANYITIPSGFVYPIDLVRSSGGFRTDLSNNADNEFLMRLLAGKKRIGLYPSVTWLYRKHSHNMSSNVPLLEKDTLKTYSIAADNNYFITKAFKRKCYAKMYLVLAGSWWKDAKNKPRGLLFIAKAFLSDPLFTISGLMKK